MTTEQVTVIRGPEKYRAVYRRGNYSAHMHWFIEQRGWFGRWRTIDVCMSEDEARNRLKDLKNEGRVIHAWEVT
jgi:hypothetical protein